MKKLLAEFTLLISCCMTLTAWAEPNNLLASRQAVKERKATFILVQKSFKSLADMAQGKREFNETFAHTEMQRLASLSSILPELFPEGSYLEGKGTKAAEAIWEKNSDFMHAINQYILLTKKFSETTSFTQKELQKAIGEIGKECKSCHNDFKSN
jgi:cytochrome c556